MTPSEVRDWLSVRKPDFKRDVHGHYKNPDKTKRFKFGERVLRYEVKAMGGAWLLIRSGYYGKLSLTEDGKLSGMKRATL